MPGFQSSIPCNRHQFVIGNLATAVSNIGSMISCWFVVVTKHSTLSPEISIASLFINGSNPKWNSSAGFNRWLQCFAWIGRAWYPDFPERQQHWTCRAHLKRLNQQHILPNTLKIVLLISSPQIRFGRIGKKGTSDYGSISNHSSISSILRFRTKPIEKRITAELFKI